MQKVKNDSSNFPTLATGFGQRPFVGVQESYDEQQGGYINPNSQRIPLPPLSTEQVNGLGIFAPKRQF